VIPYEWVARRGDPILGGWDLEPPQLRQLKALLLQLERVRYEIAVGTLIFKKGGSPGIYYSKINGNVALRPRCCVGPELDRREYEELQRACEVERKNAPLERVMLPEGKEEFVTYLERVTKKDGKERPLMKDSNSAQRFDDIVGNRQRRQRVTLHKGA
jgi:hypothetical protein